MRVTSQGYVTVEYGLIADLCSNVVSNEIPEHELILCSHSAGCDISSPLPIKTTKVTHRAIPDWKVSKQTLKGISPFPFFGITNFVMVLPTLANARRRLSQTTILVSV